MTQTLPKIRPLSRAEVRSVDQRAIAEFGINGLVLMENAGRGAAYFLHDQYPGSMALLLCGFGNNGGDGFVIARHLQLLGHPLTIVLPESPDLDRFAPDALANFSILQKSGISIEKVAKGRETVIQDCFRQCDVIVDALLGTGAQGDPRPPSAWLVELANAATAVRVAIDIPSGLDCDTGIAGNPCFVARQTLTFVAPKIGFTRADGPHKTGEVHVLDIGVPQALLADIQNRIVSSGDPLGSQPTEARLL
jgi:NAD(P)H-hydrate epimerase